MLFTSWQITGLKKTNDKTQFEKKDLHTVGI